MTAARTLTLSGPLGISLIGDAVTIGSRVWLAVNRYTAASYEVHHVELGDGEPRYVKEDRGLLPKIFAGPGETVWAVITDPYGDEEVERVRQIGGTVFDGMKPYVADQLWLDGDVLVGAGGSGRKDVWMRFDLTTGKRTFSKLPVRGLDRFEVTAEGVHGFTREEHLLLTSAGKLAGRRPFANGHARPVDVSWSGRSTFVEATDDFTQLVWVEVAPDGTAQRRAIATHSFYSLYPIVRFPDERRVLRYVGEHGNGWFVLRDGTILQHVRSCEHGWRDDSGPVVELPAADWILGDLVAVRDTLFLTAYVRDQKRGSVTAAWVTPAGTP